MKQTWDIAFEHLLISEGGFTDDPRDPGNSLPDGRPGSTNLGVTQKVWEEHVGHKVTHEDMKALTREDVEPLYKDKYWNSIKGDDLPIGIDYMVFDMGVNSGPAKAARTLQEAVGVKPDGLIGPMTLRAVDFIDSEKLIKDYSDRRLGYMMSLKGWETYGKGWERRVDEVAELSTEMAKSS